jgi:2-keto-4-pentenoate hydratase/2-oxohepta-3-ene-1,7-dioic acid hydratase in catechol pathway
MKLVTYEIATLVGNQRRVGALRGPASEVVDLNCAYELMAQESSSPRPKAEADFYAPTDMLAFLQGGAQCMDAARASLSAVADRVDLPFVFPRNQVRLLAPVPRPPTIRDFSTFEGHGSVGRGGAPLPRDWYLYPAAHKAMPAAVEGPEEPVTWPYYTAKLDLEPEIGFYVGRQARNLGVDEAAEYIAGWTIFIDPEARDGSRQAGAYKWNNFQYLMGPCLVTPDEFDELSARVIIRVNDELWFEGNTSDGRQFWGPSLLAYASDNETLYPGEFIGIGAIGTGSSIDLGKWVRPGDVYELEVEGLGSIRTTIGARQERVVGWAAEGMEARIPIPADLV